MDDLIKPPKSWKDLSTHYKTVLSSDWYKVISKLQSRFVFYTHEFYKQKGFDFQMLPITTGGVSSPMGAGSDSTPVKIDIAGVQTYLADSMQFFLEFACRLNKNGNYYIAPSFRGELADERHLCQFYHSEAEIPGQLDDVIKLVEEYLLFLIEGYIKDEQEPIMNVVGNIDHLSLLAKRLKNTLPRCTYLEAVDLIGATDGCFVEREGLTVITNKGEKELINHFGGAVWLVYPEHASVPFYQAYCSNPKYANCADLLFGIGETVGAGQRHLTSEDVLHSLELHGVDKEKYDWYVSTKSLIPMQTSGFGMGIERFLLWLLKHDDIRDIQLLPRFNGQISKF